MEYVHNYFKRLPRYIVSAPFIYMMIVPLVCLDIFLEVYHRICFALYGIAYVKRSQYIRVDRQKLNYLSPLQKLNCMYCGYANGLLQYACKIAAETERYWCGIQHKTGGDFIPTEHHKDFLPYGDAKAFQEHKAQNPDKCALKKVE